MDVSKHQRRIIPILLEDISSVKHDVDKHLYQNINSSTHIKWPRNENDAKQDRFWKRLVLFVCFIDLHARDRVFEEVEVIHKLVYLF
jgi:hypothetical protein